MIWFCWTNEIKNIKLSNGHIVPGVPVIHQQGQNNKTRCGIKNNGLYWDYDVSNDDPRNQISCKRCLKSMVKNS